MSEQISVEEFIDKHNEAPYDDDELLAVAKDVKGEVGTAAREVIAAKRKFDLVLNRVGYERG